MKIGIWVGIMPSSYRIMATLAKERHPSGQKPRMVTAMDLVAVQTVLGDRHMLKCIGASLFGVALITKIIHRIGLYHCLNVRRPHRIMAAGACQCLSADKFLFYGMMGLFVKLGSDATVTVIAEVRLPLL